MRLKYKIEFCDSKIIKFNPLMNDTDSCEVCASDFTTVKRSPVTCPSCEFVCCKECVQKYLVGIINDAHCMNCVAKSIR